MLILKRKVGESIFIGINQEIKIMFLGFAGGQLKLGVEAPKEVIILREELLLNKNVGDIEKA